MSDTTEVITLPGEDLAELIGMLEWLHDWFTDDPEHLEVSLRRIGLGLFTLDELRGDIARFSFLLGGEHLPSIETEHHDNHRGWS